MQDCVVHVDNKGKILFQHIFSVPMNTAGMIDSKEFILLQTRSKWYLGPQNAQEHGTNILILNLETHTFQRTPHKFFNQETDQYIVTFPDTKYLCIKQLERYNDNHFKLSYYQYPLTQTSQPFNVFDTNDGKWTYQYIIKQGNSHSMICWFKARHDQFWDFRTYDLRDPQNPFKSYNIKQQIGIPYDLNNVQCALNTMWQTRPGQFMMVCISNKTDQQKNKELGVVQNNYILNVNTEQIREAKYSFGLLQQLVIDQTNLGDFCMFRTFGFKDGKPLQTPIYYIDNKTQQIVAQQTWQCSDLHKDEPTGVQKNMLVHNQYGNGDCDFFICQKIKINIETSIRLKQAYMQFLFHMNDNFEDDLLQDVIQLLEGL